MKTSLKSILLGLITVVSTTANAQNFSDATSNAGINHSYGHGEFGGGVSFVDYNRDGWDDLTFATSHGEKIHVYKNLGNGKFDLDTAMTPPDTTQQKHITWIDYDRDGDFDLFVSSYSAESRLYRNDGDTTLVDVTNASGVATYSLDSDPVFGVCWGDYNRDGWPDLYITKHSVDDRNYLFRNNKNGTFTDVAVAAGVDDTLRQLAFCAAFIDYNNDGYQDIYISYDRYSMGNSLFKNNGNGTFTDVSTSSGADIAINAMSVGVGDYDNNDYLDIYITNTTQGNKLIKNNGNGTFTEVASTAKCEFKGVAWAANFLDYDNDRDWDLYVSGMIDQSTQPSSQLYENNNNTTFGIPSNDGLDYDTVISFSNAFGDYNNDGYPDIAVNNYTPYESQLWENNGGSNNWVKFQLEGVTDTKEGIGTWIDVYAGGTKYSKYIICGDGFLSQHSTYPTMGLKTETKMDSINVRWLDGTIDRFYNVAPNRKYIVKEGVTKHPVPNWINKSFIYLCPGDSIVIDAGDFKSYKWSDNSTDSTLVIKSAGSYTVTVTNEYNFDGTSPILNVVMLDTIKADITAMDAPCKDSTGEIHVDVTQGVYPLTFLWTSLTGDTLIKDVTPGTYNLTIKDTAHCFTYNGGITVNEPTKLEGGFDITDNLCFGEAEGKVLGNASGGTLPYSYDWNTIGVKDSITSLAAGWYYATITDDNGCEVIDSAEVKEPAKIDISLTASDISCFGETDGEITTSVSGGVGSFDYLWSTNDMTADIDNLGKGWHILTVTDDNDCEVKDSIEVMEPDELLINLTHKDVLCNGDDNGEITASVSGGTGSYNYNWTPSLPNSANVTGLSPSKYILEVTDANNCTTKDSAEIEEPDAISLSTGSAPDTGGQGVGSAWVEATGGVGNFTYLWSDSQDTDTATGLTSGNYTVTVTDDNGCEETENINVGLVSSVIKLSASLSSVSVYPNPATNEVKVDIESTTTINATVKIVDINGRVLNQKDVIIINGDNHITLDVTKLTAGTYFISIEDGINKLTEVKLLVTR